MKELPHVQVESVEKEGPDILQRYTKLQVSCVSVCVCVSSWKRFLPWQHFSSALINSSLQCNDGILAGEGQGEQKQTRAGQTRTLHDAQVTGSPHIWIAASHPQHSKIYLIYMTPPPFRLR